MGDLEGKLILVFSLCLWSLQLVLGILSSLIWALPCSLSGLQGEKKDVYEYICIMYMHICAHLCRFGVLGFILIFCDLVHFSAHLTMSTWQLQVCLEKDEAVNVSHL